MTPSPLLDRIGYWSSLSLVILGLGYLGLIAFMVASGAGLPPAEPYQTIFNILILITAVAILLFWTVLHQATPVEGRFFSQASLAFIVVFTALTCINRYVGLTVVRQSLLSGHTDGLEWFLPYGWPSVMLALEFLAWGFFFGLACIILAPVFRGGNGLERAIFWSLIATGSLSVLAVIGQVLGSSALDFSPFTLAGILGWGPGLTLVALLLTVRFRRIRKQSY